MILVAYIFIAELLKKFIYLPKGVEECEKYWPNDDSRQIEGLNTPKKQEEEE